MVLARSKSFRWSVVGAVFRRMVTVVPRRFKSCAFFLGEDGTVVAILSALDRLIDIGRHPFLVFGKRRVGSSLVSLGERGVMASKALNSVAFARYCSAENIGRALSAAGGKHHCSPPYPCPRVRIGRGMNIRLSFKRPQAPN